MMRNIATMLFVIMGQPLETAAMMMMMMKELLRCFLLCQNYNGRFSNGYNYCDVICYGSILMEIIIAMLFVMGEF